MANLRLKDKSEVGRPLNDNDLVFITKTNENTDNPSTFGRIKNQIVTYATGLTESMYVNIDDNILYSQNILKVKKNPGTGEFLTIESALASISNNTSANTYTIEVGSGTFVESTILMKPYVSIIGVDKYSTIIETNNPNSHVIIGSDFSSLKNCSLNGATGSGYCAIYHTTTAGTTNTVFLVNNVVFGNNDTQVHCYADITPSFVYILNSIYGGINQFNKGFIADNNSNTSAARILMIGCNAIGMSTPYPSEFATANGTNCEIITNGCQIRTGGLSSGTALLAKNGGKLRLLATNIRGWARAIATDNIGLNPIVRASGILSEDNTMDIDIQHPGTTGYITGSFDKSKTFIQHNSNFYITGKDKNIITVGLGGGSDFETIESALNFITDNDEDNSYVIKVEPGIYYENELFMKPYVSIIGESILTSTILPIGNHNLFTFTGTSTELLFLTLSGIPSGYAAINVDDAGDYNQCHKLSFWDCDTNISIISKTQDTYFYAEYIDFNGTYKHGLYVQDLNNSNIAFCNAENYYNLPIAAEIFSQSIGTNAKIDILAAGNKGSGVEHCFCSVSGGTIIASSAYAQDALYGAHTRHGGKFIGSSINFLDCSIGIFSEDLGINPNIEINASSLVNCTEDIRIDAGSTTGYFNGVANHEKIFINENSPFYIVNKDQKIVTVAIKGADHTSVKDAYDSITGASDNNRFLIKVGPGIFIEDEITMRQYIDIEGAGRFSTTISASNPSNHVFVLAVNSSLHKIRIEGSLNTSAVYHSSPYSTVNDYAYINAVTFGENKILVENYANQNPTITLINDIEIGRRHFDQAFKVINNVSYSATSALRMIDIKMPAGAVSPYPSEIIYAGGVGTDVSMIASRLSTGGQALGGNGFYFFDGVKARINAVNLAGFQTGITIANIGAGPDVKTLAFSLENNTMDVFIDNPYTIGNIFGGAELTKMYVDPASTIGLQMNETSTGTIGTITVGDIYQGTRLDRALNLSEMILAEANLGLSSGGEITKVSGLTVSINAGYGYLITSSGYIKKVSWPTTLIPVVSGTTSYIGVDENNTVAASASEGDEIHYIVLGSVFTRTSSVHYFESTPIKITYIGNRIIEFINDTFGIIYETGSIVTENGVRKLDVTPGKRYYRLNEYSSSGGTPVNFEEHWRLGDGTYHHGPASASTIDNISYDYGSGLTSVTTSYFAKHSLYITGEQGEAEYLFVYAQAEYSGLTEAVNASLPTPPPEFIDSTCIIASIITQQGATQIAQIIDERPRVGFNASSVSSTLIHANLQGLLSNDHPQYLQVNGTAPMQGALNMGNFNINNVGEINGVSAQTHASRHLPNGADPLVTAAPTANIGNGSANSIGVQNSLSRSDHSHRVATAATSTYGQVKLSTTELDAIVVSNTDPRIVSVLDKLNKSGDTMTGQLNVPTFSATTLSAATIFSGNTNLYDIFLTTLDGNDITRIHPGTNTYTAGTANNPSVNISAATLNNLTVSGTSSLETVSATTLFSASTNLTAIFAPISLSQFPIDINRYGFLNHTETGISFDGVDTLTLSGVSWSYYRAGIKYTISGNKTIQVASPMVNKTMYYIFIDAVDGTLTTATESWTLNDTKVPVATIYWDATLLPKYILADERHQCTIDRVSHRIDHFAHGTEYISGGIASGYTLNSTIETDKTFSLTSSVIADEDMFITSNLLPDGNGTSLNYYNIYRTAASSYAWLSSDMPFKYASGATHGYIEYDNGSGVSTPSDANKFVNTFIICTNAVSNYEPVASTTSSPFRFLIIQGRGSFDSDTLAYAESFSSLDLTGFPIVEAIGIYQMTWSTSGYSNTVKGRCVLNRVQKITGNILEGSAIYHNSTAGIQGGVQGQYLHLNEEEHLNLTSGIFSASSVSSTTLYSTTARINTLSASTIFSGNTNLYDIFLTSHDGNDITRVQPGTNTTTGGTVNNPTVNLIASPSVNSFTASGNTSLQGTTATTFNATTIQSGGTNLSSLFVSKGGDTMTGQLNINSNLVVTGNSSLQSTTIHNLILSAGTSAAGDVPLKFMSGATLSSPEAGAIEYDGTSIYYTGNLLVRQHLTPSSFGTMFEQNAAGGTAIAVTNTRYTGWVNATFDGGHLASFTNNVTADRITIGTGGDGDYKLDAFIACTANNATPMYSMAIFRSNSVIAKSVTWWNIPTANTSRNNGKISIIVTGVTAGEYFDLRFSSNNATSRNIVPYTINLSANRINR